MERRPKKLGKTVASLGSHLSSWTKEVEQVRC